MVTIRLRLEVSTPTGETVKSFPILPGDLVVSGIDEIFTADIEQIEVHGETHDVQTIRYANPGGGIRLRLTGTANNLTDSALKTLVVDIIQEPR